jgi:hypothetical protein
MSVNIVNQLGLTKERICFFMIDPLRSSPHARQNFALSPLGLAHLGQYIFAQEWVVS